MVFSTRSKKVSVNCKFEELGGDSLKALVLVGRIAKNLQTQFTLTDLALYNTVALISEFITLGEKSPSSNLICFKPSGNKEPFSASILLGDMFTHMVI